jgi:hypothetical protein
MYVRFWILYTNIQAQKIATYEGRCL